MEEIDRLFSFPAILSVATASFSSMIFIMPAVLFIALMSHALPLIGIFAPNALSIVPAGIISKNISVPSIAFDQVSAQVSVRPSWTGSTLDPPPLVYQSSSVDSIVAVQHAIISSNELAWSIPSECGVQCQYHISYEAPTLQCSDISPSSILTHYDMGSVSPQSSQGTLWGDQIYPIFNATSNLGLWYTPTSFSSTLPNFYAFDQWTANVRQDTYSMLFTYYTSVAGGLPGSNDTYGGSYCVFHRGVYESTFIFHNNTQEINATVASIGQPLNDYDWGTNYDEFDDAMMVLTRNSSSPSDDVSAATLALTSRAVAESFAHNLVGVVTAHGGDLPMSYHTNALSTPLFAIGSANTSVSWTSCYANMSQAIMDLFTNTTLSFNSPANRHLLNLTSTATVLADIVPNYSVWRYSPERLWLVYGIGLVVVALCDLVGLACLTGMSEPGDMSFSRIMLATQSLDLMEYDGDGEKSVLRSDVVVQRMRLHYTTVNAKDSGDIATAGQPRREFIAVD